MIIKVAFNGELRRVTVADEKISLKKLQKTFRKLFGPALPANYVLKYTDDEDDIITVTKDKELNEAVRLFADSDKILRLSISDITPATPAPELPKKPAQESSGSIDGALRDLMDSLHLGVDPSKFLSEVLPNLLKGLEVEISVNEPRQAQQQQAPTPAPAPATPAEKPQSEVEHAAFCDACNNNKNIRGIRYKCLTCPDYDLCAPCFEKKAHGAEHEFRAIFSGAPLFPGRGRCGRFRHGAHSPFGGPQPHGPHHGGPIHPIHGHHGPHHGGPHHGGPHHGHGPKHGGRYGRRNWREEQREVTHHAFCDGCKNGEYITGARYKCLDEACPDFDLCSSCEAAGFQDATHKNTHQMRCIANPGEASFENVIFNFMRGCPAARSTEEPIVCSPAAEATAKVEPAVLEEKKEAATAAIPEMKEKEAEKEPLISEESDSDSDDEEEVRPAAKTLSLESFEPLEQKEEEEPLLPKAEEAAPVVVAAAPAAAPSLFESMLTQLAEMGFGSRDDNIKLLVKHNGDLLEAVKELLD